MAIFALLPLSVFAVTADPDTAPTITQIHVNRNIIASGDMIFTGQYDIPYATPPTLAADQTFFIRLMDTVGTTELGSVTPFNYTDYHNGYGQGAFGIYLTPAQVTALSVTWDGAFILQIAENPSQFASPLKWNTTVSTADYTTFTTLGDNAVDLATQIFTIGQTLAPIYGKTFFSAVGSREIFTSDGETYFRGAITGLQSMAPDLFVVQQNTVDLTPRSWTTASFDAYLTRFTGTIDHPAPTWVGDAMTATGDQFGMSGNMAMGLLLIGPLCLGMLAFSGMKFKTTDPGLVGTAVVLEMGAVMGWVPAAVFATIFQLMGIYIAYLFFFSRG